MGSNPAAGLPETRPQLEIRHTFASVLREYARVACVKRKEDEMLQRLTEGGSDPAIISKLEEQKRQEERRWDMKRMQEKRLSALLSREDAFLAKQLSLHDVKLQAETVRKEKRQLHEKADEHRRNRSREIARIIEECRATKRATREALHSMVDQKRRIAAEISEESRQLLLMLIKQKEEDTRRKAHLVREVKAIRATRSNPTKNYDPAESSNLGFLCEMSMVELREKVLSTKVKLKEEIERRNSVIRQERERRTNLIRNNQRLLEWHKTTRRMDDSSNENGAAIIDFPEIERLQRLLKERKMHRCKEQKR